MARSSPASPYVHFEPRRCRGEATCVKVCPTRAIRLSQGGRIHFVDRCIGCGECLRVCRRGATSAKTEPLAALEDGRIHVALVSPVLYAQFPGVMPMDVLLGLRQMGFHHTVDMSYFLEMFHCATKEFIFRNRQRQEAPWPLISPVCPVVVRLIAFGFPNLLPHLLPIKRPMALMAQEVKRRIAKKYAVDDSQMGLYYINPCPTKAMAAPQEVQKSFGINDIYAELTHRIEGLKRSDPMAFGEHHFEFEYCATGNGLLWGMSGGEINDMNLEKALAVSGLKETVLYLEKIELGLFRDLEYIELRTCPEGCLGGPLNAIDKYLAKSAVRQMIQTFGLGRRMSEDHMRTLYEKGVFKAAIDPQKMKRLFGSREKPLSLEQVVQIDRILKEIKGRDCAACGAPNCRTFAEDVVRNRASMDDCLVVIANRNRSGS